MGTIMQQTAVLKLGNYSFYNYRYVYFAAHAGASVYMLDNSQSNIFKKTSISILTNTTMIAILMITCNCLNNR